MNFKPLSLKPHRPRRWLWIVPLIAVVSAALGLFAYRVYFPSSLRWVNFRDFRTNPEKYDQFVLRPGMQCAGAPFAFPTTGAIFGLWDQSYRPGHRHQGLDIFPGGEIGLTGVYAAYPGYLTRLPEWVSTVIIRIPEDPLVPNRQIWNYYTHMADEDGDSFVAEAFPPGTEDVFVPAGTFLGYVGNYSGDPNAPTGIHLHFSVVKDEGGVFLNEINIRNTYDPSPYFNLAVNHHENSTALPVCPDGYIVQDWALLPDDRWAASP